MINIRSLKTTGIDAFTRYLTDMRDHADLGSVSEYDEVAGVRRDEILYGERFSEEFPLSIPLENEFPSRYELGTHLFQAFERGGFHRRDIDYQKGLWSWLALFLLERLIQTSNGSMQIRLDEHYIQSASRTVFYRHRVSSSWRAVADYGERARLFLYGVPLHTHGELMEQFASQGNMTESIVEVADQLYWDHRTGTRKYGAMARDKGSIRRFVQVLKQFRRTYDLGTLPADDLLSLLPAEFDRFKSEPRD
tara:strand:- start:4441 stop:5190 length:750 start_codon:yes stop_codon:yes gene_type:complete